MEKIENGLYLISTPIGNLEDVSLRAQKILNLVDFIVCENPIHSLKLLNKLGIKKKLFSLHDYNEDILIKRIEKYQKNSSIALISDAGSPLISDPGYNLVQDYIKKNLYITSIPGPSSIISSLQLSGLPIDSFRFFGFVSKNKSKVKILAKKLINTKSTSVFFISGKRLLSFLKIILDEKINRKIALCKELTKKNEAVFRGELQNIIEKINKNNINLKGEFTVLIDGKKKITKMSIDDKVKLQIKGLLEKFSLTKVVDIVHKLTNISKKEVYKMTLKIKND